MASDIIERWKALA